MNRIQLYSVLPDPDEVGQSEYRMIHNYLVDAINEWDAQGGEDISEFVLSVNHEIRGWTTLIDQLVSRQGHDEAD